MEAINDKINFYAVEELQDGKYIHLRGYFYNTKERTKKPYRLVFVNSALLKLKDFLRSDREEVFTGLLDAAKQSCYEMDKEEAEEQFRLWQEESSFLPLGSIQLDTPAGEYRMEEM